MPITASMDVFVRRFHGLQDCNIPTYPLYCHWTEEETDKFDSITSKWKGDCWGYLFDVDCLPSWVYELTFDEFMVKLTKDKDERSMEDVLAEYTGCDYLFG